jgi:Fe-S oxidoreductase
MSPNSRLEWAQDLPFDVKVVGEDIESLDEVDWLFWVGCAGAYEDRAKKTTRAVAELLDLAGVSFGVLGNGETCSGDPARRAGNEFIFQQLAMQNAEMFKETKVKKVVSTCAHCFNTLKNEYSQLGIELEVVHHTQLLNRLVREGRLTPVAAANGAPKRAVTYHDPCYLGRHNKVYEPPRELLDVIPSTEFKEMERNQERSFCCGAGGARMWMEERIGKRINFTRAEEAAETLTEAGGGSEPSGTLAVGCPFCRTMMTDGVNQTAGEAVQVQDVSQMLLTAVKRGDAPADTAPEPQPETEGQSAPTTDAPGTATPAAEVADEAAKQDPTPAGSDGASSTGTPASSGNGTANGSSNGSSPEEATPERSNEN